MTIYSLDVLLFLFGTSLGSMSSSNLLPDLHTDFSGGRSGGLVFPSLSEFSTEFSKWRQMCKQVSAIKNCRCAERAIKLESGNYGKLVLLGAFLGD